MLITLVTVGITVLSITYITQWIILNFLLSHHGHRFISWIIKHLSTSDTIQEIGDQQTCLSEEYHYNNTIDK